MLEEGAREVAGSMQRVRMLGAQHPSLHLEHLAQLARYRRDRDDPAPLCPVSHYAARVAVSVLSTRTGPRRPGIGRRLSVHSGEDLPVLILVCRRELIVNNTRGRDEQTL